MTNKMKYVLISLVCLMFAAFSLLAPQVADHWYDRQTLGQLSYEKIEFQACEIRPYQSFSDQMRALTGQVTEGIAPYAVQLQEREDAPDDRQMQEILNEELEKLCQKGILPEDITVTKLEKRYFYQLYAMPLESGDAILQDIYYWTVVADTKVGTMALALDSTFHKIYGVNLMPPLDMMKKSVEPWMEIQMKDNCISMAQAWCSYWELEDARILTDEETSSYVQGTDKKNDFSENTATDAGLGVVEDYEVFFTDGSSFRILNRLENPMMYYDKQGDWVLRTGMGTLLMVM